VCALRFFHLSDLHLGKLVHEFSMLEEQAFILQQVLALARQERPDAVLVAGDVYDRGVAPADALKLLDDFLVGLSGLGIRVFLIAGNHDSAERLAFASRLMAGAGVHIAPAYEGVLTRHMLKDEHGDGWFPTGDVATIDADGFMQITDRSKDVIKSGGEWISSIDVENIAVAHPAVAMAACIGIKHPKWDERPIIAVVKKPGADVSRETLLAFYEGKIAKWQIPDDVVFVDAIPLGGTGKMQKTKLREMLKDYQLPGA